MKALSHLGQGEEGILIIFIHPLLYGMCIYLLAYIFLNLTASKEEEIFSYNDCFIQMGLSPRERSIAELIIEGKTNKVIGNQLFIAESTVKKHVQNILRKTQCANRQDFCQHVINYNKPVDQS